MGINFLKMEADLYPPGKQKDYATWLYKSAIPVEIVSYKTLDIANKITAFIKRNPPKIKSCFTNSYNATLRIPGVEYVEGKGMFKDTILLDHGWNVYQGKHFDLTAEILFTDKMFTKYLQIINLDLFKMNEFAYDLGYSGPFTTAYYYKNVLKQWDEETVARCVAMM